MIKKMLKVIAMLFVVATVVFAAGCTSKTTSPANNTPGASVQVTPTQAETTPTYAETSATTETPSVTNENVTENSTGNNTTSGTHMSSSQRKMAMIQNRTQGSS